MKHKTKSWIFGVAAVASLAMAAVLQLNKHNDQPLTQRQLSIHWQQSFFECAGFDLSRMVCVADGSTVMRICKRNFQTGKLQCKGSVTPGDLLVQPAWTFEQ